MSTKFNNDKATDAQRSEYLEAKDAYIENHGDDDEPDWMLFYKNDKGRRLSMNLDAQSWEDAIFEACNIVEG